MIAPSLDWVPEDGSSLKKFGNMLNKLWKNLSATFAALFLASAPYTPVLTALAGTYTTASVTGRYFQLGRLVYLEVAIIITTVGTGTNPIVTLPIQAAAFQHQMLFCKEDQTTGVVCSADIGAPDFSHFQVNKYDNTNPAASSTTFYINGFYETV